MPKATLEYDLSDEFERNAHKRALNSTDAYLALHKIENTLRAMHKYQSLQNQEEITNLLQNNEECNKLVELIRDVFYNILEEEGVNMDDLE
jgi:hypothetical protein